MTKDDIISEYKRVKQLLEHQPSKTEFLNHSKITEYKLMKVFGINAFSKLVEDCGDIPNNFKSEKSTLANIFQQYGKLARKLNKLPVLVEWNNAGGKPLAHNILKVHQIKWTQMPLKFLAFVQANNLHEYDDVVSLMPQNNSVEEKYEDNSSGECFVYLMFDTKTNFHKIGISKVAEYREKTLQSEKPSIKLIAKKKYVNRRIAANFEKALHDSYSHKRKRGEWFLLDEEDLHEIKATLND